MPAMSDGFDSVDEPRKLRSQTRSSSLEKSPTQRLVDAGKTFRNFFSADKRNSKRKRSTAASKSESMDSNGGDGMQDVTVAFETAFSQSANDRDQYGKDRTNLLHTEAAKSWDHQARESASDAEKRAANIILKIREDERENLFGDKASEAIPGPETLDMGGQFLTNKDRIEESRLFAISQRLPKGAHLHIHFNSEFPPDKLLTKAKVFVPDTMFIRSTQPILNTDDLKATEMVFNVLPKETPSADIFSKSYKPEFKNTANNPWMKWTTFTADLKKNYGLDAEDWVQTKMILGEDEVYAIRQTTNGIWARFNQGTRCFKGLMNYESVYRWYISEVIESMIEEHVMYTELRPMLMDKSIPSDDGKTQISNSQQMKIILEEWEKKKAQLKSQDRLDAFPFGLKIIYCTPRSIPKPKMKSELQDCIKLKLEFPDLICGFDLVGAEDRPNHIGFYKDELLAFVETCKMLRIEIPFMFHAGETLLDTGGSRTPANSNLFDALLLNSKRIGHGFSLVKHPELSAKFREKKICIELCPTSNELLHLCRNIKEHPYPELLALGIPCTVNSDNPSLFRGDIRNSSSLSFEFYQVMVGATTMSLHGWKQMAEWSLEYSCLSKEEIKRALEIFKKDWEEFCTWVIDTYGAHADALDIEV